MTDDIDLGVLAESFAEMLGAEWPRERAVAWSRAPALFAHALWDQMAALGWTALTVPESHGGLGLGTEAAAALHSALGAAAAPVPMLGTTLATALLVAAGSEAQGAGLLPRLADGSLRAAVAQPADGVVAIDGGAASGSVADMIDAPSANILFLRGDRAGRPCWIAVPTDTGGVTITPEALTDATHSVGTVTLDGMAIGEDAIILPSDPAALDDLLLRTASIAIAADAVGGGEAVLAGTIDYMKVREQFGVAIGSFQALKHRVADHQAALVAARGLVEQAAALASDDPNALLDALSAKQHVTRVVAEIARDCIQLHGGVGFTAEFFPHIYLKRGKLNEALFGTRVVLLDRIADLLEAA
jgi:alkylation response protein AidB-like acyl-CoA dehydrogenase